MDYLEFEDICNIHLTSKKSHEIANNYRHQIVINDDVDPAALMNFSRICDDVEVESFGESGVICDFFVKAGTQIKNLTLRNLSWTPSVLIKICEAVPNVHSLELDSVVIVQEMENLNDQPPIKLTKLRFLTIHNIDSADFNGSRDFMPTLLNLLVFSPTKVSITGFSGPKIESFLHTHKDSIKKLKLLDCEDTQPNLTGFELEHLYLDDEDTRESPSISISLLTQPNHLKLLHLGLNFTTAENLNFVFHNLEGLEVLELKVIGIMAAEYYQQLSRFKNLKKLVISDESWGNRKDDIVLGLTAGVNENLVELKTRCSEFSSDDFCELSRCLPNLKKLEIGRCAFENFCYRSCFGNLKKLSLYYVGLQELQLFMENSDIQPMTNIKVLKIELMDQKQGLSKEDARFLAHVFPALVKLSVFFCHPLHDNKPVLSILKYFPHLKTLMVDGLREEEYDEEFMYVALPLIHFLKKYRRNLEWIHLNYARFNVVLLKNELAELKGLRLSSSNFDIVI